ncbi:hypothetical protein [Azospirillum doebereinerae]
MPASAQRLAALTDAMLAPILDRLDPDQPGRKKPLKPIDLRDRALLLVGRDTLARADELVALRWTDLHPVDPVLNPDAHPGEATIRIQRSKTDQGGQGAEAWLSAEAAAALAAWRAVAPWRRGGRSDRTGRGRSPGRGATCSATCRAAAPASG